MVPLSPLSRKRGSVAVSTTGSRTITSTVARPSFVAVQAIAMTRAVPANSGISKLTSAEPSAATVTIADSPAIVTLVAARVLPRSATARS